MLDAAAATTRTDLGLQFPWRERPALGAGAGALVAEAFDVQALIETAWADRVSVTRARPNVLIHCPSAGIAGLIGRLRACVVRPVTLCPVAAVPGSLPRGRGGTLMVYDVAALSVAQQIDLYDWTSEQAGQTHVIAITSVPLAPRVEGGQFLQALYRRLNVLPARVVEG